MSTKSDAIMLAEHILEIRHDASGTFLDVRGYVADYIRNSGIFPHWRIESNVVNFTDGPNQIEKEGAFAGYKNAGFMAFNPPTKNYFVDKASSYWNNLIKNQHYQVPEIQRFGARTKVFVPTDLPFDSLKNALFEKLYTNDAKQIIGGSHEDLQFVFNLKEAGLDIALSGGPMHEGEAAAHFRFEDKDFGRSGLFLDVDCSKEGKVQSKDIHGLLKSASEITWSKVERISSWIGL